MSIQAGFGDVDRLFKLLQSEISDAKVHIRSFKIGIQKPQGCHVSVNLSHQLSSLQQWLLLMADVFQLGSRLLFSRLTASPGLPSSKAVMPSRYSALALDSKCLEF